MGLTWLHISDWHQRSDDFDRKIILDALLDEIRNRGKLIGNNVEHIDFVVFTGDIASNAQNSEYEDALRTLIEPLLEATGLKKDRLFIVPGNHDIDRSAFELLPPPLLVPLETERAIIEWLTEGRKRSRVLEPFEAFSSFLKKLGHVNSIFAANYSINIDNTEISIIGLNSALMSGRYKNTTGIVDDYGKLCVGENQVYEALIAAKRAQLRIVIMHHPFEWLVKPDKDRVERRIRKSAHFVLCGHLHSPAVKIETGTIGDCIFIPAGATYDIREHKNPFYANAYNYVHLDLKNYKGMIYLRRWSNDKWREDRESWGN